LQGRRFGVTIQGIPVVARAGVMRHKKFRLTNAEDNI
jgi:hypothetical protein